MAHKHTVLVASSLSWEGEGGGGGRDRDRERERERERVRADRTSERIIKHRRLVLIQPFIPVALQCKYIHVIEVEQWESICVLSRVDLGSLLWPLLVSG